MNYLERRDCVNLIAHLGDPRFDSGDVHHEIEARDRAGITIQREHRAPDALLAWIDATFGGIWSSEVARSGVWYARDRDGFVGFAAYDARMFDYRWLKAYAAQNDVGIFGPMGVVDRLRGQGLGTLLMRAAMYALRERGYRRAVICAVADERLTRWYEREAGARIAERVDRMPPERRYRTTVLASGNGSNFAAVAEAAAAGVLPLEVTAVIANHTGVRVLERARDAGIPAHVVVWDKTAEERSGFDARVLVELAATEPELVLMLGWMHIMPALCVNTYPCLNVHPAFLPFDPAADRVTLPDGSTSPVFRGAHAVEDALAAGARYIGASVHRVGVDVDRGRVLARLPLRLEPGDDRRSVDPRLKAIERSVVATSIRRWTWEQD